MKFRLRKIAALVFTAVGATALAAGVSGCVIKSVAVEEPDNIEILKLAPPDDGSLPTAHSCAENLAYINYVFDHQEQYHSYSNGVTIASIATQTTRTFRDYKDGILVTTDLTYSSMIKNSTQTCTVLEGEDGKSEVYFRVGDAPTSNGVYPTDLEWEQEAPRYFSEYTYHYTYGLLPNELFNYIINEDTLISSDELVVNGDGTYSQSFVLDPVASTYYYQYGMKTRGGLAAYPTFQSIKFTVTFDKDWQILSSRMNEVAMVNKGILVESKSEFTCDYFYGGDHFDQKHYDYYQNYYKQYVGDETLVGGDEEDENAPLDVASVLSNGFSKIMNGGEQYEISAKLGSNTYSGYVWLTLDLEDIASSLALKVSLGKDLKNQTLYAEYAAGGLSVYYGKDFGVNANLAAVKLEAQRFEQLINQIVGAITGNNSASGARAFAEQDEETEESDPLSALMGCMKLEENDDTAVLSLVTDDLLGLGIGIDVKLVFGVNGKSVLFRSAEVGGIVIGGQKLDISLGLQTTTAPVIDRESLGTEADIADYVADVYSLLSSDLLKVELKLDGTDDKVNVSALKNISAEVTAFVDIYDVTVGAEAKVSYFYNGMPVSATVKIIYDYTSGSGDYGNAVLMLTDLNGAPADVKLYCNVSDLVSALGNLLTSGGEQTSVQTDKLIGMLNSALSVNFSNLLTDMYADKAQIKIGVSVDTLLDMLGVNAGVKFGSCTLCYSRGDKVYGGQLSASLPAIGFSLSVCGSEGEIGKIDKTECLDLTYVLDDVLALGNADLYKVNLTLNGGADGVTLNAIKDLKADLTANLSLNGIAVSADAAVSYNYNGNEISAKLSAWYDYDTNKIALYLSEVMGAEVCVKLYCNVDELIEGVTAILDFAGVSLGGDESGVKVELSSVLTDLLGADFKTLLPVLETNSNGLKITANADEIVKLFGVDLGISLGNIDLAYLHGEEPKVFANAPALGLSVEISGADGEVALPDTDEYLDLAYVIDDVLALAQADLYKVNLALDGGADGVTLNAIKDLKADLTANLSLNGIAVSADAAVSYNYNGNKISAKLSAWYDYDTNKIALYLSEVMGAEVGVKLYCNVDELIEGVTAILDFAGVTLDENEDSEAKSDLSSVLSDLLGADFKTLLPVLETNSNGLKITANADEIVKLFGAELGISLGNIDLAYLHGEEPKVFANAPALGLSVEISGADGEVALPDTDEYLDLAYVIDDVLALAQADLYKVNLTLDGGADGVTLNAIKDLKADLTANLSLNGIAVSADATVSYNYNGNKISAKISAWYDYDTNKIALYLSEVMGAEVGVKLYCNVDELIEGVTAILDFSGVSLGDAEESELSEVLAGVLGADFGTLLPVLETNSNGLKITANADEIVKLFGVDLGISLGNIDLAYLHGVEPKVFANAPALGLSVEISGADGEVALPDTDEYLDLAYVIDDVLALAQADLYKVNLTLDGSADGVTLNAIKDLKADLTAYLNLNGISVGADAAVSYKVSDDNNISAKLSVWYDRGAEGFGRAVVSLKEINGVETSMNVCCDIDELITAVESLLKRADIELSALSTEESEETADVLGEVLTNLLNADFGKFLPGLTTNANGLRLSVNVDEVLSLFGLDLGISFKNLQLKYLHGADSCIFGELPALGLSFELGGAEGILEIPDGKNCLDLVDVVDTVNAVWEQIDGIIDNKSISFNINKNNTFLGMDGIIIGFGGNGEISWAQGREFVALDLVMSITGIEESGARLPDEATVKVIYDKNADESEPFIRLAINGVGLDIYRSDIEGVKNTFGSIYNKVKELLGTADEVTDDKEADNATVEEVKVDSSKASSNDTLFAVIFKALASDGWVKFLNDFTLTSDGKSVALSYLTDNAANIKIGTDNNIRLYYDGSFGSKDDRMSEIFGGNRFALSGEVTVTSVVGTICDGLNDFFDEVNKSTAKNEQTAFLRLAYDFLFEGISCFSVENILGSDTYAVNFNLNGNNCNIDALEDVFIDAQIYVTGARGEHGKLAEGFLNIDAAGIIIKLNVITERTASGTNFYVELNQIMDVVINLKFLATQDSLYRTLEALVNAVNHTDVIEFVSNMLGSSDGETTVPDETVKCDSEVSTDGAAGGAVLEEDKVTKITSLIENILNFNFSDAFVATSEEGKFEVDGVLDATIDLDNIITQLAIVQDGFGQLGSARVVINHNDHSMTTYGTTTVVDDNGAAEVKEWISLTSKLTEARDYSSLDKDDYISVEFLPDLLSDIVKFATDDEGKIYDSFTLSGSITASINLVVTTINANIDVSTLTVSFGENGLSLSGILHINKISALSVVTIPESTVGISISNGYVTLAKGLTSTPEYKIMTMEYFLDHMLVKSGSVLEWWLDVSGWSTLISIINKAAGDLSISSGLTTPEEIYLYKNVADKTTSEISMYDYVDSLRVMVNGVQTACFGNYSSFEKQLGISDNYYGFALNGGKISGGVLNKLYAAITRNDTVGISGVKAYASIDAGSLKEMVKLSVNLGYEEGLTAENDFVIGNTLARSGVRAPDFYTLATAEAGGADQIDFAHNVKKPESGYDEIFGCFTVADKSYDYSHMLYTHKLTIVNLDGTKEVRDVRHGSTVYLYDNYSPAYTDNTKAFRLLYSTEQNALTGTSVTVNADTVIYAVQRESVKVVVHSGNAEYEITSFVGDSVPREVKGLEAVETPYYEDGTLVGVNDKINDVQTLHIYGTFVQSVVTVNYVNYQFSFDQSTKTGSYTAVGRAAGFNSYYCTDGNTLVLESEIDGYPVTAIAAEAFANTEGYSVMNVVVPATVTSVGENAFLDNVGMQSAVFLADTVTFGGSSSEKESGNTTPFYGCSAEAGGKTTNLIVYYNTIVFEGSASNKYWTKFKRDGSGAIYNRYYIGVDPDGYKFVDYDHAGGGAIYGAGTWQFVNARFELDLSGVGVTKLTDESVENFLASYYPFVSTTEFIGSAKATETERAIEVYLAKFDDVSGGITYKCTVSVSYEKNGNITTASYFISFTQAASITVLSNYDCVYYGVNVPSNTATVISIPVESLEYLATPTDSQRILESMERQAQEDGSVLVKLDWREKYTYKFTYTISGSGTRYNDTLAGKNNAYALEASNSFDVIEGQEIVFERSSDGHVITIYVDGEVKTVVTLVKFTFGYYSFKTQGTNDYTSITASTNASRTFKY